MELRVEKIKKSFGRIEVLKNVSFHLRDGEVLLLLGPNASGKSTLLRIISTISKPDSGRILLDGVDVVKSPSVMRGILSYVPEVPSLIDELSVEENLKFFAELFGVSPDISKLEERFRLTGEGKKMVSKISKGMRQRLSLAVSMMRDPKIVILDEPTSGLDRETIELTLKMIEDLSKDGRMVLVTSHDEEDLLRVATHVAILESGEITIMETVENLENERMLEIFEHGEKRRIRIGEVVQDIRIIRVMGLRESLKLQRRS